MDAYHVVALSGSYRRGGVIDQAVDTVLDGARSEGATTEKIRLVDHDIRFCTNCRDCTQAAKGRRGACPIADDVAGILDRIDRADALVLASPVNCLDVTAITRAVLERLLPYYYWPWGQPAPQLRLRQSDKFAVLITSSAMPTWMGRLFTNARRTLRTMAKAVGAKPIASLHVGLAATEAHPHLSAKIKARAHALGERLVTGD